MDADVLAFFQFDNMHSPDIFLHNLDKVSIHRSTGIAAPVTRVKGHYSVLWNSHDTSILTTVDLH